MIQKILKALLVINAGAGGANLYGLVLNPAGMLPAIGLVISAVMVILLLRKI